MAFHGVIVYEIIENAGFLILNGIYCNNVKGKKHDDAFEINNEIAKREIKVGETDRLIGKYKLRYIDSDLVNGTLIITVNNEAYYLEWFNEKSDKYFTGIGLRSGGNHLSVSYIKA